MKFRKIVILAAALAILPLSAAFARGAGGFTWGQQYFDSQFANFDLHASYTGVYGYRVTYGGQRIGGFAMAVHSEAGEPALSGGFVGAISGQEFRLGPFSTALNLWTGFGGISANPVLQTGGSLALFAELDLEVGLGFTPGMSVTGYAGMQAVTSVLPDQPLFGNVMYTPVMGVRIAWGS